MKQSVYQIVTDQIIKKLDEGVVPWRRSWTGGMPMNLVSKRQYNGLNAMMLALEEYDSPYWLTFNQCKGLGGKVKKGEKSTMIIYWNKIEKKDVKEGEKDCFFMLKYFRVFNTDQCEGLEVPTNEGKKVDKLEACENVIKNYVTCPEIKSGGSRAYYQTKEDYIQMPPKKSFESAEGFYSVLFHEMGHSTGHESRLNRKEVVKTNSFGSEDYSKEELVAEFTSAFLCANTGIAPAIIDNAAAYIESWKSALKEDAKLLVSAASKAQKATKYILGE